MAYPQFSRHYVEFELPFDQGRAFLAVAHENSWKSIFGLKRMSPGYIAQELSKLQKTK